METMMPAFEYPGYWGNFPVFGRAIRNAVSVPGPIRVLTVLIST